LFASIAKLRYYYDWLSVYIQVARILCRPLPIFKVFAYCKPSQIFRTFLHAVGKMLTDLSK